MANIHTFVVRTAVKAGMYTLPTREHFLKSIGETDCALPHPRKAAPVAAAPVHRYRAEQETANATV